MPKPHDAWPTAEMMLQELIYQYAEDIEPSLAQRIKLVPVLTLGKFDEKGIYHLAYMETTTEKFIKRHGDSLKGNLAVIGDNSTSHITSRLERSTTEILGDKYPFAMLSDSVSADKVNVEYVISQLARLS